MVNLCDINSLNFSRFTSFVASARTFRTSTIISTIKFIMALDGLMLIYVSSRWKKSSMWLKRSISLSRLALSSLAAWEARVSKSVAQGRYERHRDRPRGERRSQQILHWYVEMPESRYKNRNSSRGNILIFTFPTISPMAAENKYRTFTVGVTHFVSLSSPFLD